MDTVQRVKKGELIGITIKIIESKNKFNKGKQGKIIDETRNTVTIQDNEGNIKKLIKEENEFEFEISGKKIKIKGSELSKRPEERIY